VIFLLDTNAISALMRGETKVESWLSSIPPQDRILTCTIVRGEILFGLGRLARISHGVSSRDAGEGRGYEACAAQRAEAYLTVC
jgi:predicted nucleic acid-binding protein